jgi:hypothetical protein
VNFRGFVFLFAVLVNLRTYAQQAPSSVSEVLAHMQGDSWADRSKALDDAGELCQSGNLTPIESDRLQIGIIELLIRENSGGLKEPNTTSAENNSQGYGEDKFEYYAGLITYVAGLHDERAIPALLGAAATGGVATKAVAQFGDRALEATLAQVSGKNSDLACGALDVVREMLHMKTTTSASWGRISNALRDALSSADYRVRVHAINVTEYSPNPVEFVPMLKKIADHDPYRSAYGQSEDGRYVVRHMAKLMLQKISAGSISDQREPLVPSSRGSRVRAAL